MYIDNYHTYITISFGVKEEEKKKEKKERKKKERRKIQDWNPFVSSLDGIYI